MDNEAGHQLLVKNILLMQNSPQMCNLALLKPDTYHPDDALYRKHLIFVNPFVSTHNLKLTTIIIIAQIRFEQSGDADELRRGPGSSSGLL